MKQNLKPITLPIDPAKAHLYVARNGVGIEKITVDSLGYLFVNYTDGKKLVLFNTGEFKFYESSPYDLTHEITPEPEAPGRDWSGAIGKLIVRAIFCHSKNGFNAETFHNEALAILQEFEREWLQAAKACISDKKDSNKPEESAPTEELTELVIGEMYDFTAPKTHEVDFFIDVYRDKNGGKFVLPISIKGNGDLIASGLHFKRTFTEGEGL